MGTVVLVNKGPGKLQHEGLERGIPDASEMKCAPSEGQGYTQFQSRSKSPHKVRQTLKYNAVKSRKDFHSLYNLHQKIWTVSSKNHLLAKWIFIPTIKQVTAQTKNALSFAYQMCVCSPNCFSWPRTWQTCPYNVLKCKTRQFSLRCTFCFFVRVF